MIDQYLVLFNDEFVEIRDVMNGKLFQIIAGQNIRCLDDAQGGFGKRNVVSGKAHSDEEDRELLLELLFEDASSSQRAWEAIGPGHRTTFS